MNEVIQVSPAYSHYEKVIRCHGVIDPTISRLKWYDINRSDQPFEQAIRDLARSFVSRKLTSDGNLSAQELGFVLLHRCGEGFYFLGLCTWRGNNELWKTIFFLDTETEEDFALVIGNTLAGGRSIGLAALSGIVVGGMAHSVMAYLGIGLILQAVPGAFSAMLFLGAAYLAWLGYQLLMVVPGPRSAHSTTTRSHLTTMGQGIITCLLNPKAYFFMFAIFPQFIRPEKGSLGIQVIILGLIIALVQTAIYGGSAWSMSKLTSSLSSGRTLEIKLSRAMGVFLIVIACLSVARGIWGG